MTEDYQSVHINRSFITGGLMNNHVHRALLEERMRKEKDKKGNAQKRLTLLNK